MTWNYRVMQMADSQGELVMVEAYYDQAGALEGWTGKTLPVGETVQELRADLEHMLTALELPVLTETTELARLQAAKADESVPKEPDEQSVPFVAIGAGERAPWATLSLDCPTCGEGPLPLQESGGDTGLVLRFISHCGKSWMRGDIGQ